MNPHKLSILHISATDNKGGSGRSAYRIHTGLREAGVRSRMLVSHKVTDDPDVGLISTGIMKQADRVFGGALNRLSLPHIFYPSSYLLLRHPWFRDADVIQLYNIHGYYFSHTALPLLNRFKPVVWRLSDMWPMTGHCYYPYDCERWKTGCGNCRAASDSPPLRFDTTAFLWHIKRWVYDRASLTVVAPSKWIAGLGAQSPLLSRFPVHIIPNGLDLKVFKPVHKSSARRAFGIDQAKKVILFSAGGLDLPRKGWGFLRGALERLPHAGVENLCLLIAGGAGKWRLDSAVSAKYVGFIESDETMAALYSAADIYVQPTLADNTPNTIIESMACGTPVVSFNIGGVPEILSHMETGYLAAYKDIDDLANGISTLLADSEIRSAMGRLCREKVEQEYSLELQSSRFESLYNQFN